MGVAELYVKMWKMLIQKDLNVLVIINQVRDFYLCFIDFKVLPTIALDLSFNHYSTISSRV